jgi:hypothetical protein
VTATATVTVTATPTPEPGATSGAEPNVGDTALAVGEWREGRDIRSNVLEVTQPSDARPPSYLDGEADAVGAPVKVRSCVRETAADPLQLGFFDWVGADANGGTYEPSGSSWGEWPPLPQYPAQRAVRPGQCVEGWLLLQTQQDTVLTTVGLDDGNGSLVAEWNLG